VAAARGGGVRGGARLDVQRVDVLLLELVLVHDLDGELVLVRPVDREPHRREPGAGARRRARESGGVSAAPAARAPWPSSLSSWRSSKRV